MRILQLFSTSFLVLISFGSHTQIEVSQTSNLSKTSIKPSSTQPTKGQEINVDEANSSVLQKLLNNMIHVEGGSYTRGCTSEQGSDCESDEKPAHQVSLSSFSMGKYEVTQAEWRAVMGSNPSRNSGCNNCPVENISWEDTQDFLVKLNELTGKNFRLPTEAEWEYAARGGKKSKGYQYSGSNDINIVAWYRNNSSLKTYPVGSKQPNELGFHDMSGNVAEWCSDWYSDSYFQNVPSSNPNGPTSGSYRIIRGGSWLTYAPISLVAMRNFETPETRCSNCGFRIVLSQQDEVEKDTPEIKASEAKSLILKNLVNNMVFVEGGSFTMGCTPEQGDDCESDEKPAHRVSISSFSMGKYEVTQAEWQAVMGSNPSGNKGCDNCPVESVSWDDIQEFLRKLTALTGKTFRLPTEAEWEYAARGGNKSRGYKYSGSNDIDSVAWYVGNSGSKTRAVGGKQPNELGLYDMTGNVWEWCSDWYSDSNYHNSPRRNPQGPSSGASRILRGGSWHFSAQYCRVPFRFVNTPGYRFSGYGFRVVLDP